MTGGSRVGGGDNGRKQGAWATVVWSQILRGGWGWVRRTQILGAVWGVPWLQGTGRGAQALRCREWEGCSSLAPGSGEVGFRWASLE